MNISAFMINFGNLFIVFCRLTPVYLIVDDPKRKNLTPPALDIRRIGSPFEKIHDAEATPHILE
jgi:hypothetical protein